jgi:hypothetical protein
MLKMMLLEELMREEQMLRIPVQRKRDSMGRFVPDHPEDTMYNEQLAEELVSDSDDDDYELDLIKVRDNGGYSSYEVRKKDEDNLFEKMVLWGFGISFLIAFFKF